MKGKKTDPETIYKIMIAYAVSGNCEEVARQLKLPPTTVHEIVKKNKDEPEFEELCRIKRDDFIRKADNIINKATRLLDRRLDVALENEEVLEGLIDEVYDLTNDEMNYKEKQATINKIRDIQLNKLSELTTAIGTIYDKKRLAENKSTENVTVSYESALKDISDKEVF